MRELKDHPLDTTIYSRLCVACGQLNVDHFYLLDLLHKDERPLYYMELSFYFLHLKQLS